MKEHYCHMERQHICFEGECAWCGEKEVDLEEENSRLRQRIADLEDLLSFYELKDLDK